MPLAVIVDFTMSSQVVPSARVPIAIPLCPTFLAFCSYDFNRVCV